MEQNKLKLEDCCLTMYQAKELQELGVYMNNTQMVILQDNRIVPTYISEIDEFFDLCRYDTPTLTNTEMLEMLPKEIDGYKLTFVYDYFRNGDDKYYIGYLKTYSAPLKELESTLLRNSLFGMIKWLKINKLM